MGLLALPTALGQTEAKRSFYSDVVATYALSDNSTDSRILYATLCVDSKISFSQWIPSVNVVKEMFLKIAKLIHQRTVMTLNCVCDAFFTSYRQKFYALPADSCSADVALRNLK